MSDHLRDIVGFQGNRLFNGAVNIGWFGTDDARTQAAAGAFVFHGPAYHGVSQADVGTTHGHRLQDTASFARSIVRRCYGIEDQPFTLAIAGYGTGKSHLGLTLAAVLSQPAGKVAGSVLNGIDAADKAIGSEIRAILDEARQPCLVVALNGMQNFDLTNEVTRQILVQIKASGLDTRPLDNLRPRFAQAASLIRMAVTNMDLVNEVLAACDARTVEEILTKLEQQDEPTYGKIHHVLAAKNITISALGGQSICDVITVAAREYCGSGKPFRSLIILFDEFGRYTEFATERSHIAGSGALQDLFEGIQANAGVACFAGFIQFELNAYTQRVAPENRNEILRYVTRYQTANRVYLSINLETLIASLIEKKKPAQLDQWFDSASAREESKEAAERIAKWFPQALNHRLWNDPDQFHSVIRKGCWPLSPFSAWFLFHLAASGKHLQERSALALLSDVFERFHNHSVDKQGAWCLAPVDFWSDSLQHELITSEEGGQQGAITLAYASVEARHGTKLNDNQKRLLRATVLASKMGLKASTREDATEALAELSGLHLGVADKCIQLLQDELNVLEWDEAFKEFDILGDAVPRTQFLSFVRKRVASSYDEAGKSKLFASKGVTWCDLLGDQECDFAEDNKITTREWVYRGLTSNLDLLLMQLKLAADQWSNAMAVDEPRGTIIYCYVEPSQDMDSVAGDIGKMLRGAAKQKGYAALPILVVLLCDEEGALGQAVAELAVLDESVTAEEKVKFGNLIPAHQDKMRAVVRSQVETMIKRRQYVTAFNEPLDAQRLNRACSEVLNRIYKKPVVFPFDGFSTARGNAADSCQELTADLLLGHLDWNSAISKPVKIKNRAVAVLKDSWEIFAQNGKVRARPGQPVLRALTEKWDDLLNSGDRKLSVKNAMREICYPPYGANIASAGLFLGVFIAPRIEKLAVVRSGQTISMSQWIQDGLFRGKFIDYSALHDVDLVLAGEGSSEWDALLDEWEQAESHLAKCACLERAASLSQRIPVSPTETWRKIHLETQSRESVKALAEMVKKKTEAINRIDEGLEKGNVSLLSWGGADLAKMMAAMGSQNPLWTDLQIDELRPSLEQARQAIIQSFPAWVGRQAPRDGTVEQASSFRHTMRERIGGNLKELGLHELFDLLAKRTDEIMRNIDTAAEARQVIRDVQQWLTQHSDATRIARVAELRGLQQVGKEYTSKLQGLAARIQMQELGEVRSRLSETMSKMKDAEKGVVDRLTKLWKSRVISSENLEAILAEVDSLMAAFEGCESDLADLQLFRRALKLFQSGLKKLETDNLTWTEYEAEIAKVKTECIAALEGEELPWDSGECIECLAKELSQQRKAQSAEWIESFEQEAGAVSKMDVAGASRLYSKANTPPTFLTAPHAKRLESATKQIKAHLDDMKLDWMVEEFKAMPESLRKKFLQIVAKQK